MRRDLSAGAHISSLGLHEQNYQEQKVVLFLEPANCMSLRPFRIPCSTRVRSRHTKNIKLFLHPYEKEIRISWYSSIATIGISATKAVAHQLRLAEARARRATAARICGSWSCSGSRCLVSPHRRQSSAPRFTPRLGRSCRIGLRAINNRFPTSEPCPPRGVP